MSLATGFLLAVGAFEFTARAAVPTAAILIGGAIVATTTRVPRSRRRSVALSSPSSRNARSSSPESAFAGSRRNAEQR